MWGFLSCFFCLFLDRTSAPPSSSSRARLLRAPVLSLLPSLGLEGRAGQGAQLLAGPVRSQGTGLGSDL